MISWIRCSVCCRWLNPIHTYRCFSCESEVLCEICRELHECTVKEEEEEYKPAEYMLSQLSGWQVGFGGSIHAAFPGEYEKTACGIVVKDGTYLGYEKIDCKVCRQDVRIFLAK